MLALRRVLGDEAVSVWSSACIEAGLEAQSESILDLSPAEMCTVAKVLAKRPGLVGALGVSLRIRCETYLVLKRSAS